MNTNERPKSCDVTDEQLAAMGFPVLKTDKVVGTTVVVVAGDRRGVAVHKAWAAGLVTLASAPTPETTWAEANGWKAPKADAEMMAWAEAERARRAVLVA